MSIQLLVATEKRWTVKGYLAIVLSVLCVSCYSSRCHPDEEFKAMFYSRLDTIRTLTKDSIGNIRFENPYQSFKNQILYLGRVTGLQADVAMSHYDIYYPDTATLTKDLNKWERWYQKNKCWMTVATADSLSRKLIKDK